MKPCYYKLTELIEFIDEPHRTPCKRLLHDNFERFRQAPGSSHNHQAWPGGYWDHITEIMNWCLLYFHVIASTGRLQQLPPPEQFSLSDALLVCYLHDIEKPWTYVLVDGQPERTATGSYARQPHLQSKADRVAFAQAKIAEYGFQLTPNQLNGLQFVEGIRDSDYTPDDRLMSPLAALCHMADSWSARGCYNFPLPAGNAWGQPLY